MNWSCKKIIKFGNPLNHKSNSIDLLISFVVHFVCLFRWFLHWFIFLDFFPRNERRSETTHSSADLETEHKNIECEMHLSLRVSELNRTHCRDFRRLKELQMLWWNGITFWTHFDNQFKSSNSSHTQSTNEIPKEEEIKNYLIFCVFELSLFFYKYYLWIIYRFNDTILFSLFFIFFRVFVVFKSTKIIARKRENEDEQNNKMYIDLVGSVFLLVLLIV